MARLLLKALAEESTASRPSVRLLSSNAALLLSAALSAALAFGCDATLGETDSGTPGDGDSGDGDGGKVTPAGTVGEDDIPSPATRFRRLGHTEWVNTTRDLFGVSTGPVFEAIVESADDFRPDPVQGGYIFEGNGTALEVDSTLWSAYQRAAADIAFALVSDSALFDSIVPEGATDAERGAAFIEEFGAKAHRRPLTADQIADYQTLFEAGQTAYLEHSGLQGGVRLVLESLLQSPFFVYRVEASDKVVDGVIPLDGYERAARLSYFFWGTMPDDQLFAAAESGSLDDVEGVRAEAERLVADPRARDTIVRFFDKVLDVEKYETISPSPVTYPEATDTLPESARQETTHFVEGVMHENSGSLRDFFTSTTTFVDDELASIYGLEGTFSDTFQEVQLDPAERAGILTQVGFLATNATSVQPDPIHRGVFLAKRINCLKIAAPPDDVPPVPEPMGQSNRQLIAEHTEMGTCANCHANLINPYGFAYENYDAVGAFRTEDGPHPVDASAEVLVDGGTASVNNALDLANVLASSTTVHECMSGHLIAFAQGRSTTDFDEALIHDMGAASLDDAVPFRQLMVDMAVAISFLNRATEAE